MTKIETFTKANAKEIQAEVMNSVNEALAKFGVKAQFGGGSFQDVEIKLKLTLKLESENTPEKIAEARDKVAEAAKDLVKRFGINPVSADGTKQIVDYKPRNTKYPIIYLKNGKRYKTSLSRAKYDFA